MDEDYIFLRNYMSAVAIGHFQGRSRPWRPQLPTIPEHKATVRQVIRWWGMCFINGECVYEVLPRGTEF